MDLFWFCVSAGMMVVPPLSPARAGVQTATVVTPTTPPGALGGHTTAPVILQQGGRELQVVHSQQQQSGSVASSVNPATGVSATGGTIHHLGQSPARGTNTPLVNPVQPSVTMSSQIPQQQQQQQPSQRAADAQELLSQLAQQSHLTVTQPTAQQLQSLKVNSDGSTATTPTQRVPITERSAFSILTPPNIDMSTLSPERPRKRIKLEEKPAATEDMARHRKLICDQKLQEMAKIKMNYREHLAEVFFLQQGCNIMDYHAWKRRPPVQLLQFLKTAHLDSDDEEEGIEQSINNEV